MRKQETEAPAEDPTASKRLPGSIALRAVSETVPAERESMRVEARAILVRILVRNCLERRKVAA